jgi:hypothetical protein
MRWPSTTGSNSEKTWPPIARVPNHELQRAIYQAYLQAALQICADCYDRLGIDADAKLRLELLPDFFAAAVRKVRRDAPLGFQSQADEQWLDAASSYLSDRIADLRSDKFTLPAVDENPEFESLLAQDELLLQPGGAEQRHEVIRSALCDRILADLGLQFGEPLEIFTSRLRENWFEYLCVCFRHSIKNDQTIANIFQSRLLARIYVLNERGQEREIAPADVEAQLERFSGELAELIKSESSRVISNLSEELRGTEQRILQAVSPLPPQTLAAEPLICHLNLQANIVDREAECRALLDELKKPSGRRVIPIAAPGGFGKTSLVIKLLQAVTDGRRITSPGVQSILTLDGRGGELTLDRIVAESGRLAGKSAHFQQLLAGPSLPLSDMLRRMLAELSKEGDVWIVLDNFEDQLEGDRIKSAEIEAFVACCHDGGSRVRAVITTRAVPRLDGNRALSTLGVIDKGLWAGLPDADAIAYLRREGANCGLAEATDELLRSFARRVHRIPLALVSVVCYLLDDVFPDSVSGFPRPCLTRRMPCFVAASPLLEPDVRISRIRLSL